MWFTWDVPAMVKAGAQLAGELIRIAAPSAAERAGHLEVDVKSKKEQAKDAWRAFSKTLPKRQLDRRLQAERDRAALEPEDKHGSEDF